MNNDHRKHQNIRAVIEEQKQKREESRNEYVEMEVTLNDIISELRTKRIQVKQLEEHNKQTILEKCKMKRIFDDTSKASKVTQLKLNIMEQEAPNVEKELFEKRDALMKIQLNNQIAIQENASLKQQLEVTKRERDELTKKLDVAEIELERISFYQNDIIRRDSEMRRSMEEINESINELMRDHIMITELSKKRDLVKESIIKVQLLSELVEKLSKEKKHFKELYVKDHAKLTTLEGMLKYRTEVDFNYSVFSLILSTLKEAKNHYGNEMKAKNEILNHLTKNIEEERSTSCKLIYKKNKLKKENDEFKKKVDGVKKQIKVEDKKGDCKDDVIIVETIKTEAIVINDS